VEFNTHAKRLPVGKNVSEKIKFILNHALSLLVAVHRYQ
jgi:hypothetical protein